MSSSALYEGTVRHRRFAERAQEFEHRVALAYIDLDELPELLGGRLVRRRPGLVRLRNRDLIGRRDGIPVADAVRERVAREPGCGAPEGPIRVLTQPRTLGHCFNPVSFYYCFTPTEQLDAVVAEVTSTPWGERHAYVVSRAGEEAVLGGEHDKAMHVSPFLDMEQRYLWRVAEPGPTLSVHIENRKHGERTFDATLSLAREELTRASLARTVARYPLPTLRILTLIYGHAALLKVRGVSYYAPPETAG